MIGVKEEDDGREVRTQRFSSQRYGFEAKEIKIFF